MIAIQCIGCREISQVSPESVGQVVACPHCGQPTPAVAHRQGPPPPPPPMTSSAVATAKAQAGPPPPPPVPATKRVATSKAVAAKPQAVEKPAPETRRPPTREEQLARRAKLRMLLAIGGGLVLAILAVVLAKLGQP